MLVLSFVTGWVRLSFVSMQGAQVVLIVDLVDALPIDLQVFARLLVVAQVAELGHIKDSLEASDNWMVTLTLVCNQLGHVFEEAWDERLRHFRGVLHCGALVDLE